MLRFGTLARIARRWVTLAGLGVAFHTGAVGADSPTPAASMSWGAAQIQGSHAVLDPGVPWAAPARPLAAIVVVEQASDRLAVFDGDSLALRGHITLRPNRLESPVRFSADGRYAYIGTRDGWISRLDLWRLVVAAEVRSGETLQALAISGDGAWLLAGHGQPHSLVLLRPDLSFDRLYAVGTKDGQAGSGVSAIVDAATRRRFVVALADLPEVWEISYDPRDEDIYDGMVHDFRMGEGIPRRGFLGERRIKLPEALQALFVDPPQAQVLGQSRTGAAHVVNLDVRRRIAALPTGSRPRLQSSASFVRGNNRLLATLDAGDGLLNVIDFKTWKRVAQVPTAGPGRELRSHAASPHVWSDASLGAGEPSGLTVIDKARLEVVATLREPGLIIESLDFAHDGRRLFASARSTTAGSSSSGALLVYDADKLIRLVSIPMARPGAVFNVGNAIERAKGQLR